MKTMRLFSVELKRLLCGRLTWLVIFLTAASPAAGLFFYKPMDEGTMNSGYVGNPAMAGGLAGAGLRQGFQVGGTSRPRLPHVCLLYTSRCV